MLRRDLLKLLPFAAAASVLAAAPSPADELIGLLGNRDAAIRLGEAYLAQHGPQSEAGLREALRSRLGGAETGAGLADAIAGDFAASRTVLVDSWLLSETECRLCALAALSA